MEPEYLLSKDHIRFDELTLADVCKNFQTNMDAAMRKLENGKDEVMADEKTECQYNDFDEVVDHPEHYTLGSIECIDAIQSSMSANQFAGYLKGNIMKYIWRYEAKGGVEDLRKARWYLDRLIGFCER